MKPFAFFLYSTLTIGTVMLLASQQSDSMAPRESDESIEGNTRTRTELFTGKTPGHIGSYLAARHALRKKDPQLASYYYSYALSGDPYDEDLMKSTIRAHILAGDIDAAVQVAQNLQQVEDSSQLSKLLLFSKGFKDNDLEASGMALLDVEAYGLFSIVHPVLYAWQHFADTGEAKLIKLNQQLQKLLGVDTFIALQNAIIQDMAGNTDQARQYYEHSLENIKNVSYRHLLIVLDFFRRQKDNEASHAIYQSYKEANPASLLMQGVTHDALMKALPTDIEVKLLQTTSNGVAEALYAIAGMLYSEDVSMESMLYLQLALYLQPDIVDAYLMLGNMLEKQENYQNAIKVYDAIPKGGPVYRRAQIRKAFVLQEKLDSDKALQVLDDLVRLYPSAPDIQVSRGDILRKLSRYDEAVDAYSSALKLQGDIASHHWPIIFARGISYERNSDWDEAEKDFKYALELYPGQPDVLNYLGYSWLMQGINIEKAKALLEQAIAERPEDGHIIDSMGWALYMLGNYSEALEYLEEAANLMPHDSVINDHLGDALWRVGRFNEARFQWEKALYYDPKEEERSKIEEKLKHGLPELDKPLSTTDRQSSAIQTIRDKIID